MSSDTAKTNTKLFVKKRGLYLDFNFFITYFKFYSVYVHYNVINICLDGRLEEVLMDKITSRIENLCDGLNMDFIDPVIKYLIL